VVVEAAVVVRRPAGDPLGTILRQAVEGRVGLVGVPGREGAPQRSDLEDVSEPPGGFPTTIQHASGGAPTVARLYPGAHCVSSHSIATHHTSPAMGLRASLGVSSERARGLRTHPQVTCVSGPREGPRRNLRLEAEGARYSSSRTTPGLITQACTSSQSGSPGAKRADTEDMRIIWQM
jgi:hypothetical protein